ncbi:MAG: DUF3037 domain-containing protein [Lapillicoccus sp.]
MPSITNATNVVRGVVVGYQYVVLRCVPRVEREEFVNVGVVLYAQGADFLDAAFAVDEARLRSLYPELEVPRVLDALRSVRSVCRGETGRGRPTLDTPGQRFGWLSAPRSTVVQPGPRHGGICTDPAIELDRLVLSLVSGIRSRDGDRASAESS